MVAVRAPGRRVSAAERDARLLVASAFFGKVERTSAPYEAAN
jgi:hypothetical protein